MLFKVTHINVLGHRHRARVSAPSVGHAMDQMERVYGEARGGACVRLAGRRALRVVASAQGGRL